MQLNKFPKVVILDCDGVLVRSEKANIAYYNYLFASFSLPEINESDAEEVRLVHTLSTPQVIDHFFPRELRREASEYSLTLDYSMFYPYVEAEEGWLPVFEQLSKRASLAVATNRGRSAGGLLSWAGLFDYLKLLVTVGDVERPKPAPDMLNKAVAHFGAAPAECVYLGDSQLDKQAAASAGVPFVGFRTGDENSVSSPEEFFSALMGIA